MGRGGYIGGSTIIGRGGRWPTSLEPLPSRGKLKKNAIEKGTTSKGVRIDYRLMYLWKVIACDVAGTPPPKVFKKASQELKAAVAAHATPIDWAQSQTDYARFRENEEKKGSRRARRRKKS